jgi:hypothetical protein
MGLRQSDISREQTLSNDSEMRKDSLSSISDMEKGYQLLLKNKRKANPPIDEDTEKLSYLDEKHGSIG